MSLILEAPSSLAYGIFTLAAENPRLSKIFIRIRYAVVTVGSPVKSFASMATLAVLIRLTAVAPGSKAYVFIVNSAGSTFPNSGILDCANAPKWQQKIRQAIVFFI